MGKTYRWAIYLLLLLGIVGVTIFFSEKATISSTSTLSTEGDVTIISGVSPKIEHSRLLQEDYTDNYNTGSRNNRLALHEASDGNLISKTDASFPKSCDNYYVKSGSFPSIKEIMKQKGSPGFQGGHWSACTHLTNYGLHFMPFFARLIAFGLKPRSVLEFGGGLGTTSDFLSRFVSGGSNVVCIEPNPMLAEVFDMNRSVIPPKQLALNVLEQENRGCVDDMMVRYFSPVNVTNKTSVFIKYNKLYTIAIT